MDSYRGSGCATLELDLYALVDAKNARRLASDSGISDNTRVPGQNLSLLPHGAGRIGGPRRSPADFDTIMQL
jgi:hypothetical protein